MSLKKFNSSYDKPIARWSGVCAGIAYFLGVKTWLVRFAFTALTIAFFPSQLIVYFILAMCLPTWYDVPEDYFDKCE